MLKMKPHSRWYWLAGCALLILQGCSSLPQPPSSIVKYDLGQPPAITGAGSPSGQAVLAPIAVARMQTPLQADGDTAVYYRLAYADQQARYAYTQAYWSLPPGQMVLQRLREHLGQTGRVVLSAEPGSLVPTVGGQQAPVLRLALEEFDQVFLSAAHSEARMRVRATLVNPTPQGDVLLAQQVFAIQKPAASANAAGGVQALVHSVDALGQQLVAWMQGAIPTAR